MFGPVVGSVLYFFNTVVGLYEFVVILAVIASWLIAFEVLSMRNKVNRLEEIFMRLVENKAASNG